MISVEKCKKVLIKVYRYGIISIDSGKAVFVTECGRFSVQHFGASQMFMMYLLKED